jgi:hypothetical protein
MVWPPSFQLFRFWPAFFIRSLWVFGAFKALNVPSFRFLTDFPAILPLIMADPDSALGFPALAFCGAGISALMPEM